MKSELSEAEKPVAPTISFVHQAILEKARHEPAYFMEVKPLSDTKISPRDLWMMGQRLKLCI